MTTVDKVTHTTILCQILQNYLGDDLADGVFRHKLKYAAKNFIEELKIVEKKQFDKFYDKEEESTKYIYDTMDAFLKNVSLVPIWDMPNISTILEAYYTDSKSMEGIAKKILKSK